MGNTFTRWKLWNKTSQTTKSFDLTGRQKLCKVLYVYDGDTACVALRHRGKTWKLTVRLYGINAAELRPERDASNRQQIIIKAARARDGLRDKVLHRRVIIEFHELDLYGRWLGTIYSESWGERKESVNEWMIQQGHAVRYFEEIQVMSPTDSSVDKNATKNSEEIVKEIITPVI